MTGSDESEYSMCMQQFIHASCLPYTPIVFQPRELRGNCESVSVPNRRKGPAMPPLPAPPNAQAAMASLRFYETFIMRW